MAHARSAMVAPSIPARLLRTSHTWWWYTLFAVAFNAAPTRDTAAQSESDLAKASQNPVNELINLRPVRAESRSPICSLYAWAKMPLSQPPPWVRAISQTTPAG